MKAKDLLGNSNYPAISYGGYRSNTREIQPTVEQIKEDMKILYAMGIRFIRTYNVQLPHALNTLRAIRELKHEQSVFEMYVMLGAWIDCKNAWTDKPVNHFEESGQNADEILRAITLAKEFEDIVKVIAVGNEAMVKWASAYYVQPNVILKWVNYLQDLKREGDLPLDLWITSSDNFASWGGGDPIYHCDDLEALVKAVDYISVHTYPMHDTHYHPVFWGNFEAEKDAYGLQKIEYAMLRARDYAVAQYKSVVRYVESLGLQKSIHIGETGWASKSNDFYGPSGSRATDEYKQALFYRLIRNWSEAEQVSCFYFQAFDEPWKDKHNPEGSENYFGLFTVDGKAKYALWELVDKDIFANLHRDGNRILKTYEGHKENLLIDVMAPPQREGEPSKITF